MPYTHLSVVERGQIELLAKEGRTAAAIGRALGRHASTVRRELRRNGKASGYEAEAAQQAYRQRRQACCPRTRLSFGPLWDFVNERIALAGWSPELIAGRLALEFPGDARMRVSHETIYRTIYKAGQLLDHLREYLPQARPKRRKRGQGKKRRGPSIANRRPIHERPAVVETREETGHWEGDLIVGKGQDGFIVTLVERSSRLLHALNVASRRAEEVSHAVIAALLDRPVSWVRTITFDNGSEFAAHQTIAQELGIDVYFADPYAAYQRGSNEQVNGLLRRYLPKGSSFRSLSSKQLQKYVDTINNRPRKCLAYRTPNEVFQLQRQNHYRALGT